VQSLPSRFFELMQEDFPKCDLLIVMGTSLAVQPFASLIHQVSDETPRVLVNRERVGEASGDPEARLRALLEGRSTGGFAFGEGNYRDALYLGDCDDAVRQLCDHLGWTAELDDLLHSAARANGSGEGAGAASRSSSPTEDADSLATGSKECS